MNRIKELRQKKGLSVRKAAEEIGISQSMLSSYCLLYTSAIKQGNTTARNPHKEEQSI